VPTELQVLLLPFLACLILTGIHVYLGIHVISRKVIFVDIALAQIAALGATVAFLLGYDPRSGGAYLFSLSFAIFAALVFAMTRTKHERVPQEAIIGLTYATASAAAILLADISPHGAEHLHDLLAGSIVWVTPRQVIKTAILYSLIGLFHVVYRKRFLQISLDPEGAYAQGVNVRLWDFLFYLSFGVVITSSVQIAGVLLVFTYLVAPAVFAVIFFDNLRARLLTGWAMGTLVSAVGLLFSYDRPSGPTIMVCFAIALSLGGLWRALVQAPTTRRRLAVGATALAVIFAIVYLITAFTQPHIGHGGEAAAGIAERAEPPEHEVGSGLDALRASLRDTHENVRISAVVRLSASGDPRILPDLVNALHDQSPAVRDAAAEALAVLADPASLPPLKHAMNREDEDEWIRLKIAGAVAGMGDSQGLEALLSLAREGEAMLARAEAITRLESYAGMAPSAAEPGSPGWQERIGSLASWLDPGGAPPAWDAASRTWKRRR
jgi:zinc/manganese transport system permease protein